MAEVFLITVAATILSFYAVAPEHRRLRVSYAIQGGFLLAVVLTSMIVLLLTIVALVILPVLDSNELLPPLLSIHLTTVNAYLDLGQLAAGLTLIFISAALFFKPRFKIRNQAALIQQMRRLNQAAKHTVLADLLMENFVPLIDHPVQPAKDQGAVHRWLNLPPRYRGRNPLKHLATRVRQARGWLKYKVETLRYFSRSRAPDASRVAQTLLLHSSFARAYPLVAPELGLRIIQEKESLRFVRADIAFRFLQVLQADTDSILYWELQNNQNLRGFRRYDINPSNPLLIALFTDATTVEDLAAYKAIGDAVAAELRARRDLETDYYNTGRSAEVPDWNEDFRHSINGAIRFFDIMVLECLYQKRTWHQWLYYLDFFAEEICRNFELGTEADPEAEFSNAYARFLYEIVSAHCGWIDSIVGAAKMHNVPKQLQPTGARKDYEKYGWIQSPDMDTSRGGNIPTAAIVSLISIHRRILETSEIPARFKRYVSRMLLDSWHKLRIEPEYALAQFYADLIGEAIKNEENRSYVGPYLDPFRATFAQVMGEVRTKTSGEFINEVKSVLRLT